MKIIKASCYDKKGRLLSSAYNNYEKSHPLMAFFGKKVGHHPDRIKLHAEILAIIRAKEKKIYKIVIERYDKRGNPMLVVPCPICQEAIKAFGIQVVSYTTGE